MKKGIILMICCTLFYGCDKVSKSIKETFKPADTIVSKEEVVKQNTESFEKTQTEALEQTQAAVQTMINTVIEKHSTTYTQHHTESEGIDFLTNSKALIKAEEALKNLPQYAGKEIFIYSVLYFYNDGTINIMLQHPENPKYVDAYDFRDNKWSAPRPIQLSVHDDIKSRLVSFTKISFTNAARLTEIYNKKASEIEGAKPLTSTYLTIWNNQIKWYPTTINGSREKYSIQFNDDGSLKSFKQD